jgi:integrase
MTKARNGEGSTFKITKPSGKVKYVVEMTLGYDPTGKRKRTRREFNTRKEANDARIRLASENLDGRLTIINAETVRKYGLQWVRDVKAREVRNNTASDYEARLRREVFPSLGNVRMTDLTAMHVERWIASLIRKGLSASTINGARAVLSGMCNYAELTGVINKNPVRLTRTVKRKMGDRTQVREPWSREEVWTVLNEIRAEMGDNPLDGFLHLMLHTGLRPGEALGLRWIDIDFETRKFMVTGTLKEAREILPNGQGVVRLVRNAPKTAASRRPLPIDDALYAALTRQQMLREVQRITAGDKWKESGYVLTTSVGTGCSVNNLRKQYRAFLDRIGVRYIRFHDLRHTVARLALDEGNVPIEQASQALGHTRIDTTKQIYAGYVPRYNDEFTKGLSNVLPPCPESFRPNPDSPAEQEVER